LPSIPFYSLSLHDALPISQYERKLRMLPTRSGSLQHYVMNVDPRDNASAWEDLPPLLGANRLTPKIAADVLAVTPDDIPLLMARSEEHTSELQSRENLVCR